jgi:hypothetical protein
VPHLREQHLRTAGYESNQWNESKPTRVRSVIAWPSAMLLVESFLAVFVRQCPFVSFHPRCSCPPRAALAPEGNSRWGLAKATVKIDKNGHKRKQTEKSKTGRRMLNQPEFSRSAPGSLVPIPSNERMQSAVLHSPVEITSQWDESNRCAARVP